jgi:septal ring factor EnvC (AmiA/AmiB activator)
MGVNRGIRALVLAGALLLLLPHGASFAADPLGDLRREKARLVEMRRQAEKTAADLTETIRKERKTRAKVGDLRSKLERQQRLISEIDRKLSDLSAEMEKTEREVAAAEERQAKARRRLGNGLVATFFADRDRFGLLSGSPPGEELRREFALRLLARGKDRVDALSAERDRKAEALSGIERRIELSERRMEREKKMGATLQTRQEAERQKLSEIETQKKAKQAELADLRARIARMDSLVTRIEREARARERTAREAKKKPSERPSATREKGPTRFAGIGAIVPPLAGKVIGRFGRQHDTVFDVDVENRGVEIQAASGAAIHAVAKGEVVFIGPVAGYGRVLILQHGSGLFSVYGKAESFSAKQGQSVQGGEEIGRLPPGSAGNSVLYLELRAGGTAIDPSSVIPLAR